MQCWIIKDKACSQKCWFFQSFTSHIYIFAGVWLGCRLQCFWRNRQRRLAVCSWFSSVCFLFCFVLSWFLKPFCVCWPTLCCSHSYIISNSPFLSFSLFRSYHGYKTMKDFVRRRRWARYYPKQLWHISLCSYFAWKFHLIHGVVIGISLCL